MLNISLNSLQKSITSVTKNCITNKIKMSATTGQLLTIFNTNNFAEQKLTSLKEEVSCYLNFIALEISEFYDNLKYILASCCTK